MRDGCPFCDYDGPSVVLREDKVWMGGDEDPVPYFVIEPLNPVTPGHLLVIPHEHVEDFRIHPRLLAAMMHVACDVACDVAADEIVYEERPKPGCNLIVSAGEAATQTVPHVHVHVVPRREGDGLALPWSHG